MNDALNFSIHDIYYNLSKLIVILLLASLQIIFLATAWKNNKHVLFWSLLLLFVWTLAPKMILFHARPRFHQ